jgi:hypothetical protein
MSFEDIQREYDLSADDIRAALAFAAKLVEHEQHHPLIQSRGHDATDVRGIGLGEAPDEDIAAQLELGTREREPLKTCRWDDPSSHGRCRPGARSSANRGARASRPRRAAR